MALASASSDDSENTSVGNNASSAFENEDSAGVPQTLNSEHSESAIFADLDEPIGSNLHPDQGAFGTDDELDMLDFLGPGPESLSLNPPDFSEHDPSATEISVEAVNGILAANGLPTSSEPITDPLHIMQVTQSEFEATSSPEEAAALLNTKLHEHFTGIAHALGVNPLQLDANARRGVGKLQFDFMGVGFKSNDIPVTNDPNGLVVASVVDVYGLEIDGYVREHCAEAEVWSHATSLSDHFFLHLVRGTPFLPYLATFFSPMQAQVGWQAGDIRSVLTMLADSMTRVGRACTRLLARAFTMLRDIFVSFLRKAGSVASGAVESAGESFAQGVINRFGAVWKTHGAIYARVVVRNLVRLFLQADLRWFITENAMDPDVWTLLGQAGGLSLDAIFVNFGDEHAQGAYENGSLAAFAALCFALTSGGLPQSYSFKALQEACTSFSFQTRAGGAFASLWALMSNLHEIMVSWVFGDEPELDLLSVKYPSLVRAVLRVRNYKYRQHKMPCHKRDLASCYRAYEKERLTYTPDDLKKLRQYIAELTKEERELSLMQAPTRTEPMQIDIVSIAGIGKNVMVTGLRKDLSGDYEEIFKIVMSPTDIAYFFKNGAKWHNGYNMQPIFIWDEFFCLKDTENDPNNFAFARQIKSSAEVNMEMPNLRDKDMTFQSAIIIKMSNVYLHQYRNNIKSQSDIDSLIRRSDMYLEMVAKLGIKVDGEALRVDPNTPWDDLWEFRVMVPNAQSKKYVLNPETGDILTITYTELRNILKQKLRDLKTETDVFGLAGKPDNDVNAVPNWWFRNGRPVKFVDRTAYACGKDNLPKEDLSGPSMVAQGWWRRDTSTLLTTTQSDYPDMFPNPPLEEALNYLDRVWSTNAVIQELQDPSELQRHCANVYRAFRSGGDVIPRWLPGPSAYAYASGDLDLVSNWFHYCHGVYPTTSDFDFRAFFAMISSTRKLRHREFKPFETAWKLTAGLLAVGFGLFALLRYRTQSRAVDEAEDYTGNFAEIRKWTAAQWADYSKGQMSTAAHASAKLRMGEALQLLDRAEDCSRLKDLLPKVINNTFVSMNAVGGTFFAIDQSTMVGALHVYEGIVRKQGSDRTLRFRRSTGGSVLSTGANTTATSYEVRRFPEYDLVVIIWLLKVIQGCSDMRKHFISEYDVPTSGGGVAILGTDNEEVAARRFTMIRGPGRRYTVISDKKDEREHRQVEDAWFYDTPTRGGFSGGIIALNSKCAERKLCGIHLAGTSSEGQGVVLTSQMLDSMLKNKPMTAQSIEVVAPKGRFAAYLADIGHLPWSQAPYLYKQITKNPFVKSCCYDENEGSLFNTNYEVVHMEPFVNSAGERVDPLALALTKPLSGIARNPSPVSLAYFGAIADDLVARAPTTDLSRYHRLWSFDECVKPSIEWNLPGVSVRKSGGFPLNGVFPEKSMAFESREGEQKLTPDALAQLEKLETQLRNGEGITAVFQDLLKVEKRDKERVSLGKTRVFSAADFFHYILCRKYFGGLRGYMRKHGLALGIPMGLRSDEFDDLVTGFVKHLNLDFSNFDGSIWPHHFLCFMQLMLRIGVFENEGERKKVNPDLEPLNVDNQVRWQLLLAIAHAIHQLGDVFYSWGIGNPSGNFLTDLINAVVVLLYLPMFLAYACRVGGKQLTHPELKEKYKLWAFGDDSNTQTAPEVELDVAALNNVCQFHGFAIQAGVKSEAIKFTTLSESVFLGRNWVRYRGKYWGAMTLDRVVRIPVFVKRTNAVESLVGQIMIMCEELAVRGRTVYEQTLDACPFRIPVEWSRVDELLGAETEGQARQLRALLLQKIASALDEYAEDHGTILHEPVMVAQSNEDLEQGDDAGESASQTVHFEDPDVTTVQNVEPAPSNPIPMHQEYTQSDVVERWVEIAQIVWTTLLARGDVLYNNGFPSLYFENNFKAQAILAMYRWLRCSGRIRILGNVSPFHVGSLWAYILYPGQTSAQTAMQKTACVGALLNVGSASYVELELPPIIRALYCDILTFQTASQSSNFDFCSVVVEVLTPLRIASGESAQVSIYADLHDASFMLPTRTDITMSAQLGDLGETNYTVAKYVDWREVALARYQQLSFASEGREVLEEEAATANFLTTADMVRQATGRTVRSIPVIGDAVARIRWLVDTASYGLQAFGLSKPARDNNSVAVWDGAAFSAANWRGSNQAMVLGGDDESNTVTPADTFSRDKDEANYQVYASRPALLHTIPWDTADPPGTVIKEFGLNPAAYEIVNVAGTDYRVLTPLGYLATAHQYNRGGIVLAFVPIGNAMVSGRLAVTLNTGSLAVTSRAQRSALNTRIWDLKDGKNFEWEFPYVGDGYWANCQPAQKDTIVGPWGTVTLTVINPLRVSTASMDSTIDLLVFMRGAVKSAESRGFEVAWPRQIMEPAVTFSEEFALHRAAGAIDLDAKNENPEPRTRKGKEPMRAQSDEVDVYGGEALRGVESMNGGAPLFLPYPYMGDDHLWRCMGEQITSWHEFIKRHDWVNYASGTNVNIHPSDSEHIRRAAHTFAFWCGGVSAKIANGPMPEVSALTRGGQPTNYRPQLPLRDGTVSLTQVRIPYAGRFPFEYVARLNDPPHRMRVPNGTVDRLVGIAADDNFRFGVQVCPPLMVDLDRTADDDASVPII